MSHDNQPVVCYHCERTVERWSVDPIVHPDVRVIRAECHGEKDSATLHVSTYRDVMDGIACRPFPMFMPPWEQTCPDEAAHGYARRLVEGDGQGPDHSGGEGIMREIRNPVICYCCEKPVEKWRLRLNDKTMSWEMEADCHGEMDLVVCQMLVREQLPLVMFQPPDGSPIDTGKWSRLAWLNADFRRADDAILKAIMGNA